MTTTPMTLPFPVTPRRDGDPHPDLRGFRLIHRALISGSTVLADVAAELDRPDAQLDPRRQREIVRFGEHVLHELHGHHHKEDDILWPVIATCAGPHIDLAPLTDDHGELQATIEQAEAGLARFARDWRDGAAVLHPVLAHLVADLRDHIAEEEATVFPVMLRYVSQADFARCEERFRKGASFGHLRFVLPWVVDQCTSDERAAMLAEAPLPVRLILAASEGKWQRRLDVVRGA